MSRAPIRGAGRLRKPPASKCGRRLLFGENGVISAPATPATGRCSSAPPALYQVTAYLYHSFGGRPPQKGGAEDQTEGGADAPFGVGAGLSAGERAGTRGRQFAMATSLPRLPPPDYFPFPIIHFPVGENRLPLLIRRPQGKPLRGC
jgi:hypothetical protein